MWARRMKFPNHITCKSLRWFSMIRFAGSVKFEGMPNRGRKYLKPKLRVWLLWQRTVVIVYAQRKAKREKVTATEQRHRQEVLEVNDSLS